MKRFQFWIDVILGTGWIFGLIGLFVTVSTFNIFDIFDPVGQALGDMEMTDPVFSELRADPEVDTNIVIVNVGYLSRADIAKQIEILNQFEPKVIAMDMFFNYPKPDTAGDLALAAALAKVDNLVMVTKLMHSDSLQELEVGDEVFDSIQYSHEMFRINAHNAYANLDTEARFQQDYKTCRMFPPTMEVNGEQQLAFGVKIAELIDPDKAQEVIDRNNEMEIINYRGNIIDFFSTSGYPGMYYTLDVEDVFNGNFVPGMIKDKILIFGFLGETVRSASWEDKFFTPMNVKYAGKANPDMFGVVIHANIVSMVLKEDYVDTLDDWQAYSLAVLICFLNVALFSVIYRRLPRWYDGLTKLLQLIEIMLMVFIMIMFFHWFSFKLNLTLTIAAVALSGDALEVYYGVIKNLFNKEQRRQLFTINR